MTQRILFVCTGNTCRSPMAEALFRQMLAAEKIAGVEVWSRGMALFENQPISAGSAAALKEIGLDTAAHRSHRVTRADVEKATLILAMEEMHRQNLIAEHPEAAAKTFRVRDYTGDGETDIDDPIGGSPEDYRKCRIEIQNALRGLLAKVKALPKP